MAEQRIENFFSAVSLTFSILGDNDHFMREIDRWKPILDAQDLNWDSYLQVGEDGGFAHGFLAQEIVVQLRALPSVSFPEDQQDELVKRALSITEKEVGRVEEILGKCNNKLDLTRLENLASLYQHLSQSIDAEDGAGDKEEAVKANERAFFVLVCLQLVAGLDNEYRDTIIDAFMDRWVFNKAVDVDKESGDYLMQSKSYKELLFSKAAAQIAKIAFDKGLFKEEVN